MLDNDIKRLTRLTAILTQLQSKRLVTATKLADKYSVSVRTIYRDIRALESAGVPIITEEGKGFSLMDGYRLPPIMLTETEANALITAEIFIQSGGDKSLIDEFSSVTAKIKAILPKKDKVRIETLESKMGITNTYIDNTPKSKILIQVQNAMLEYETVKINYCDKAKNETVRCIEPFAVYTNSKNDWIVVAFCLIRKDFREFLLKNIKQIEFTKIKFKPQKITFEKYLNEKHVEPKTIFDTV